jgi:hypothetical protein
MIWKTNSGINAKWMASTLRNFECRHRISRFDAECHVWPNPASEVLNLSFFTEEQQNITIELVSASSSLVMSEI